MAHIGNVAWCAVVALLVCTLSGLPIAARLLPRTVGWYLAPGIGWAIYSALAFPVFSVVGMAYLTTIAATAVSVALALAILCQQPHQMPFAGLFILISCVIGAVFLAMAPMAAVLPKATADGVTLAAPIFDHSKIALIDEMVRSGVPATNPFFNEIGTPDRVAYYYLWHFSAAAMAVMTNVNGWEADAALTWFTAFASLLVMMGIAVWISGRTWSAVIVLAIAATSSVRSVLFWLFDDSSVVGLIGYGSGFGGWLFQTSWAPHHVASAMCVVLGCMFIPRIGTRQGHFPAIVVGLLAAAGFQSSVWVGGVTLSLSAMTIGLYCLSSLGPKERAPFVGEASLAGMTAAVFSALFLYDQFVMAGLRAEGTPVVVKPLEVFGDGVPPSIHSLLDVPGYWLAYLPAELPAYYPAGILAFLLLMRRRQLIDDHGPTEATLRSFLLLSATALIVAWLLASVVGNNDLGWRAVLPAVLLLSAVSAAVAVRCDTTGGQAVALAVGIGFLFGLPEGYGIVQQNVLGRPAVSERLFAEAPTLWAAVRQYTAVNERVANNPQFLAGMTRWPINISWALLANRRSCYAGSDLALPFAPISAARRVAVEAQFTRVFAGEPTPDDIDQLANKYRCDVVIVTPQDGAFSRDPFLSDGNYRLVEHQIDAWKIYRRSEGRRP